jgi:hypothetical protein
MSVCLVHQEAKLKELNAAILLEPLAPVSAIEDFLWPQVRLSAGRRYGCSLI